MYRTIRVGCVFLSVALTLQYPGSVWAQVPAPPAPRMQVVAVEGEAAIHDIRRPKPSDVVVLVRDGNRKPIPRASVTMILPPEGAGASFSNKAKTITLTTNNEGYATARGLRPNTIPGPFKIRVEARHEGQTDTLEITQFNMTVERAKGESKKWIALVGVLGAAAAGGTYAVQRSRSGSSPAAASIGISPGSATVGPPR